jgi:hypothetical protein
LEYHFHILVLVIQFLFDFLYFLAKLSMFAQHLPYAGCNSTFDSVIPHLWQHWRAKGIIVKIIVVVVVDAMVIGKTWGNASLL